MPEIVNTLAAQFAVTPVGRPLTVAPVAPVVAYVMLSMAVLMHLVCASVPAADVRLIVLLGVTFMVPVAFTVPQPPVSGML